MALGGSQTALASEPDKSGAVTRRDANRTVDAIGPHDFLGQALLTSITSWLAIKFDFPANVAHPQVKYLTAPFDDEVNPLVLPLSRQPGHVTSDGQKLGTYDAIGKTIYLPQGWTGCDARGSVDSLVHHMVHHVQNMAERGYGCPHEQEQAALIAQETWLSLFGKGLVEQFAIDPAVFRPCT